MMNRTITVKGIGKVSTKPDFVELSIQLEAKDKEYDAAMNKGAQQLEELNKSILSIGFEPSSLKTTNFQVNTDYDSIKDKNGNYRQVFRGFICRHHLKLSFDFSMERLAQTLRTITKCLVKPELRILFTVKDATAVSEALLREASLNARRKAEILCEASGVNMGQLLSVNYNWGELNIYSNTNYYFPNEMIMESDMKTKSINIEPDDIDVSDTATFVWEIH